MENLLFENDELLIRLANENDESEAWAFRQEFIDEGVGVQGASAINKMESFSRWLEVIAQYSNPQTVPNNFVPSTQFVTVRKSDGKIVGMVNVRHYLNDDLLFRGGHIGDCVRESERNKGYGTSQIALALEYCKTLGIDKVLITCSEDNIASRRTIEKNGGVLENKIEVDGNVKLRFWIDLSN